MEHGNVKLRTIVICICFVVCFSGAQVDDVALESLVSRCSNLQQLDLSWTGGGGQITEQALCRYVSNLGHVQCCIHSGGKIACPRGLNSWCILYYVNELCYSQNSPYAANSILRF